MQLFYYDKLRMSILYATNLDKNIIFVAYKQQIVIIKIGDNMNFNDEIKKRRKEYKMTLDELANKLEVTKTTIMRYENGSIKNIPTNNKIKLCQILNIDIDNYLDDAIKLPLFKKPILGVVKAGYDLLADENLIGYEEVTEKESLQGDYFLRVTGDSMNGSHIFDGDLLYIRNQNDVESGQIAVVMIGNEVTVKKVIKKDQMLILEATNPEYESKYYNLQEVESLGIKIIGKVLFNKIVF